MTTRVFQDPYLKTYLETSDRYHQLQDLFFHSKATYAEVETARQEMERAGKDYAQSRKVKQQS